MADTCPKKHNKNKTNKQNKVKDGLPPISAKFTVFSQTQQMKIGSDKLGPPRAFLQSQGSSTPETF
jgi:hypothetical protein